ncbi:MAG: hypothetical protein RBR59_00470 [Sulfurimonadaceae bacterium]|jgi:hypothetical protein|nr:hypothetical protein [Sulfurimonadaceae bacterium]
MRPLQLSEIEPFLKRFDNFKDGEVRCINIITPMQIIISLAAQDAARAYDWINVDLEFNGVEDARVVDNEQLRFIDLSEGVSLIFEDHKIAFALNKCYNISASKNSICYVISASLKYKEGVF